jgi:hypothetical protein
MLSWKERDQLELLIIGSLRQLVRDDQILSRVVRVLDLSWVTKLPISTAARTAARASILKALSG